MADTKTIQTRVMLKKDTLDNFNEQNPVLLNGEIAVIQNTSEVGITPPSYSIRVGDGINNFKNLGSLESVDSGLVDVGSETPSDQRVELWLDTTNTDNSYNIPEINDNTVSLTDTWSSQKISENTIYSGDVAPETVFENKIWIDTSISPAIIKRYTGTEWESIGFDSSLGGNLLYTEIEDLTEII